jgi:hypothetical protein
MSWVITPQLKNVDGVPVGTPYGGGYVAGFISHTANGMPTHALIVAPRATGATGTGYPTSTSLASRLVSVNNIGSSVFDGILNTGQMITAGILNYPAAQFCVNLSIGGFTDWYLPSRDELDIAYFNLKPGTAGNSTSTAFGATAGVNAYAVPQRLTQWTDLYPSQTSVQLFASGGSEAFSAVVHWSSSPYSSTDAWRPDFSNGQNISPGFNGLTGFAVRAFRRIAL